MKKGIIKRVFVLAVASILVSNLFLGNVVDASEVTNGKKQEEMDDMISESEGEGTNSSENVENKSEEETDLSEEDMSVESDITQPSVDDRESTQLDQGSKVLEEEDVKTSDALENNGVGVRYQTHVQYRGWQEERRNGETAGTIGQGLQMEALKIRLENMENQDGGIQYSTYVQDYRWQSTVTSGEMAGTEGENRRIEAVRIELTGSLAEQYDVYYRVHSANYGWFDWAKNGEIAGTMGFSSAAQAIEIRLYEKESDEKPVVTGKTYLSEDNLGEVIYEAHVQDYGWLGKVVDGAEGGTTGKGKNLEALKIKVSEMAKGFGELSGAIVYRAHVQDYGWMDEVKDGEIAGSIGEKRAIQAVEIKLEGQLAEKYDIYYRIHSENYGWFDWAKNGETAGTVGLACPAQAIEIRLFVRGDSNAPEQTGKSYLSEDNLGDIVYKAHISNTGWQKARADGKLAGTVGEGKHMEAFKVEISQLGYENGLEGSVVYQAHVQDYGWLDEVKDGETAGTVGKKKQLEAVRVYLDGKVAEQYDIYYRTHVSNFGWLGWAKNGEKAGTSDSSCGMEAIEIKLVARGSGEAPVQDQRSYLAKELIGDITYSAHVENIGWQDEVSNGQMAGTVAQDKALQALKIEVDTGNGSLLDKYSGGIEYSLHVQDYGWMDWAANGEIAGTVGEGKRAEAVKIRLTGELAKYADVYYRTHVSWYCWLGWAKNGQPAGTTKCAYKLQAVEIKIVPKLAAAPGSTDNYYTEKKYRKYQNPSQYYQIKDAISLSGGGYNLSYGFEGVKVMQVIRRLGLGSGIGMGGAFYGHNVQNAVANFQRNNGLSVTGNVDLLTWLRLGFSQFEWEHWGAYVSPMKVNESSSRSDHIEAMISTAYSYMGTPYVIGASGPPGTGVDCSGLVMQALYAAGLDISPINPVRHAHPGYEYESRNMWASSQFMHVAYEERQRGDLIFYQNSSGVVIHVAIYLGNDMVIESWPNEVVVWPIRNGSRSNIKGVVRPFV